MKASKVEKPYRDWRDAVDQRLHQIYCITIEDAGIDEEYLIDHWQSNEAPFDFVEWFGNKYDLDAKPLLVQAHKRGRWRNLPRQRNRANDRIGPVRNSISLSRIIS